MNAVQVADVEIGNDRPIAVIGGMNVLEERDTVWEVAETFTRETRRLGIPLVFKASFDKANRSSVHSYRGPGLDAGLKLLRFRRVGCRDQ